MSATVDVSEDPTSGVDISSANLSDWAISISDATLVISDTQLWQLWEEMKKLCGDDAEEVEEHKQS